MENSSIQPHDVLTDYASVAEQVQGLSDDDFSALGDEVVKHLFTTKPAPHTVAPHFAQFFLHATDRDPAMAKDIAAVKMAAFTNLGGDHYDEAHEAYLTAFSVEMVNQPRYREAFEKVGEAIRSGKLPPSPVPEIAIPEN